MYKYIYNFYKIIAIRVYREEEEGGIGSGAKRRGDNLGAFSNKVDFGHSSKRKIKKKNSTSLSLCNRFKFFLKK